VHPLALGVDLQTAVDRDGEGGLGFEEGVLDALGGESLLDHVRRIGQRPVHIAAGEGADLEQVAPGMDGGRVGDERRIGGVDGIEDLIIHRDCVRRRARAVLAIGHHHRQHVADITGNLAGGDDQRPVVDDEAMVADSGDVAGGEDTLDPGRFQAIGGVDAEDPCAWMLRQHERAVEQGVNPHVGDEVLGAEGLVAAAVAGRGGADAVTGWDVGRPLETVVLAKEVWPEGRSAADLSTPPPRLAGDLDPIDDAVITGAPAQVAGEGAGHPLPVRSQIAVEEVGGAHGDAGGAKAALYRALTHERVGEELPLPIGQPFQRYDLAALDLLRVRQAGEGRLAVEEDGAASAYPLRGAAILDRGDSA